MVFYQRRLIKDTSRFRFCTAVDGPTHREGAFDQVGKIRLAIPKRFTHPTSPPPFLAFLSCRFWPSAHSEGQLPRNIPLSPDACNQTCVSPRLYKNKTPTHCAAHHTTWLPAVSSLLDKPSRTFLVHALLLAKESFKNILLSKSHPATSHWWLNFDKPANVSDSNLWSSFLFENLFQVSWLTVIFNHWKM